MVVAGRRLAAFLVLLFDGWALHAAASSRPSIDVTDLDAWLRRTPPEEAVTAVTHVFATALLGLVGAGFLVYWCATAFGLRRLARVSAWAVPKPLRYLVDGALAASVLVSAVPSSTPGAAAHAVPVVAAALPSVPVEAVGAERVHVVAPGEYLSLIAEERLGAARLWPQLCELNRGIPQPDGRALEDCDLIRPQWNIRLVARAQPAVPSVVGHPPGPSPEATTAPLPADRAPSTTVTVKETVPRPARPTAAPESRTSDGSPGAGVPEILPPVGGAAALALAMRALRRRLHPRSTPSLPSAIRDTLDQRSNGPRPRRSDPATTDDVVGLPAGRPFLAGFDGLGAEDALRAAVVEWVRANTAGSCRVLADSETAGRLFSSEATCAFELVDTASILLTEAEVERARRVRLLDEAEAAGIEREALDDCLVVSRVDEETSARWAALAHAAPRLGMAILLLGRVEGFEHVTVDHGTSSGGGAASATVPTLGRDEATTALSARPALRPRPVAADAVAVTESRPATIHVRLLGPLVIEVAGLRIGKGLLDKSRELLVYLALRRDGVRREQVIEALWGEVDPARQRHRFNEAASRLRRRLCEVLGSDLEVVVCEGDVYRLQEGLYDIDLWRLEDAVERLRTSDDEDEHERTQCLHSAFFSYGGELADGMSWDWVEPARETLRRQALDLAYRLLDLAEERADVDEATAIIEHAIHAVDPFSEGLYVRGIKLLVHAGRIDSARLLRGQLEARLGELDVRPTPETMEVLGSLLGEMTISLRARSG